MKQKNTSGFRKILAGLCVFCMMFMLCFGTGTMSVNAKESAKLTGSDCGTEKGKTASVTFNLEGNPGLWGLKFKVSYDHSALRLTSVTNGTVFSEGDVVSPENLDKEQYVFLATSGELEDISANGVVVTLNFQVTDEAAIQTYPIAAEITQAINVDGDDVNIAVEKGNITVKIADASNGNTENTTGQPDKTIDDKDPKTSDNSNLVLWAVFLLIAGGVIFALGIFYTRRFCKKA